MVIIDNEPSSLDTSHLSLYCTKDTQLGGLPIYIFHGASTTTNSNLNTSRIQAHIFSVAGYQSFPRLTISPTSPLYSAVHKLPGDDQGDELSRGLAISLFKYFNEIPEGVQECIRSKIANGPDDQSPLFDAAHAARLASQMERVENADQIMTHLMTALSAKSLSWTDIDVVLPPGSIKKAEQSESADTSILGDSKTIDYGRFTEIVELLGTPSFIPTSRLKRAPSKPTGGGKSRLLTLEQIEAIRNDLQEVLETERSYVAKIDELANVVAPQWIGSFSGVSIEHAKALSVLFPPSLAKVEKANLHLLDRLEDLLKDETSYATERDKTGAEAFARLLLQILPEFKTPYVDYTKASNSFFPILNKFSKEPNSHFARQVQETGEQKLRSWLIEPIQRLPRYVLFIESIVKKLPAAHPAVSKLLKAKDLVSEILDAEDASVDTNAKTLKRLRSLVSNWPLTLDPGRLITAADVVEVRAPYAYHSRLKDGPQSFMLLFPDHILVLRKSTGNPLSARGLLAEVDRPSINSIADMQQPALSLTHTFKLSETRLTEASEGHLVHLSSVKCTPHPKYWSSEYTTTTLVCAFIGSYEGKAAKWNEEIARARIEHRFPETTREDHRWELRSINPEKTSLGLVSAIFDQSLDVQNKQQKPCQPRIRLLLQDSDDKRTSNDKTEDTEITAKVTIIGTSRYRLEISDCYQNVSSDNIHAEDLISLMQRRLSNLQRLHYQSTSLMTARIYMLTNQKILESIRPDLSLQQDVRSARFRPISPVKVLSNFLGGIRDQSSYKTSTLERSPSKQSLRSVKDMKPGLNLGFSNAFELPKAAPITKISDDTVEGAFVQLEKTLSTYTVALQSRCGNVVGKVLRNRANADELMVNELYNVLLEDPSQYQATAEVPVDVLFAAFEVFLNRAWKEKMGPLLPGPILKKLETVFHTQSSSQLEGPFKALLQDMTPQNKRAFSLLIKLLYDLLDASGNDGDRGAITAAFAEALFQDVDYLNYISLLDRMIDNIDVLFDDVIIVDKELTSQVNSMNSMGRRTKATTPGSISSTTSSFKRRFGFGMLSRENSKTDSESRVGQILRNLSKKAAGDTSSQPASLSKSFLGRSKSIDTEERRPLFPRPGSSSTREGVTGSLSRPDSSRQATPDVVAPLPNSGLSRSQATRKKRRSSLSDISSLQDTADPEFLRMVKPRLMETPADSIAPFQAARQQLKTPPNKLQRNSRIPMSPDSASKIPMTPNAASSITSPPVTRKLVSPSPAKKENIPPTSPSLGDGLGGPRTVNPAGSLVSPKKRDLKSTQIPLFKPGISSPTPASPPRMVLGANTPGCTRRKVSGSPKRVLSGSPQRRVPSGSPQRKISTGQQRLKMQSSQKLRERLEREKRAIDEAGSSSQSELSKISEELSSTTFSAEQAHSLISTLSTKLTTTLSTLSTSNQSLQSDLSSSLVISEKKAKALDDLCREANAENELLYEKFNGELMRVLDAVKTGNGAVEMKKGLKEAQDEAARLRKENMRLKREVLGLRSQLR